MSNLATHKIPTIQELHHDMQEAFKTDQLNALLNQQVPQTWIKEHPFAKNVRYIPIERVEFMLTKIFGEWRVEVKREGQMFNSVYVCVRLHFKNPTTGEWQFHDGLGAVGVQTDKGASASDLSAIKQDAIMKALPAAESYAVKDAAEKLGKIFGKDLNRKEAIDFSMTFKPTVTIGSEKFNQINSDILTCKKTLEYYEITELIDKQALEQLEKAQAQAIKLLCDEAKLTDEEKKEYVISYMSEEASAEAIVNGLKERYGIKFLNQL